jgi:predicted RNase H-like nuclease (RuvC/YqgF family)
MKKLLPFLFLFLTSCSATVPELEQQKKDLQASIKSAKEVLTTLKSQTQEIQNRVTEANKLQQEASDLLKLARAEKQGKAKYIVTLEGRQEHFSLSLKQHLADESNTWVIDIPVDREYYDQLKEGQRLEDSFREGSFFLKGSLGSNVLTVKKKRIEVAEKLQ